MCWACNPVCGRCKPPKQKVATCPSCGAVTFFSKGEVLFAESLPCPKCGEELFEMVAPDPILCQRSGMRCAWPCGQSDKPADSGFADCPYNTPVAKRAENDKVK